MNTLPSCTVDYYQDMGHYMRKITWNTPSSISDRAIYDITDKIQSTLVQEYFKTHGGITTRHFTIIRPTHTGLYNINGKATRITINSQN